MKQLTLKDKMARTIARRKGEVVLRADFEKLGSPAQVSRVLKALIEDGVIVRLGYGVYAKARPSTLSGRPVPRVTLDELAQEALTRMGVKVELGRAAKEYMEEYANGFGAGSEYWLGNNRIAALTASPKTLRVEMTRTNGQSAYAKYDSFKINGASDKYRLSVSGYSGTAGDSLLGHSGYPFSAKDVDNDTAPSANCAVTYSGAWWYTSCHSSNLNGIYLNGPHESYANGVNWYTFSGHYESLKTVYMKVR